MPTVIRDVRSFLTRPAGVRLLVVRVETSEPGLYGLGCATFTQRIHAVRSAVDDYLAPFLTGREVDRIEDIWQSAHLSGYWRTGPVLNNALSGVDQALWDLKGKQAGMPVYDLLGGRCRECAPCYTHARGRDPQEVLDRIREAQQAGFRHLRAQVDVPPYETYGSGQESGARRLWEPTPYLQAAVRLFDFLREQLGFEVELLHDVHERVPPPDAIRLARELEPHRLFFLEDPFAPEDVGWFERLRNQTVTPLAMGELFSNPAEYLPLIQNRWIDFIRVHVSTIGGISPARKLAALCEYFGVRTAWHGPTDVSPVGHAANLHLDLACPNFGIQELMGITDAEREVFPGSPELRDGSLWPNDRPGLGVDLDERAAARYPVDREGDNGCWPPIRRLDGGIVRP